MTASGQAPPARSAITRIWVAPFTEAGTMIRPQWLSNHCQRAIADELARLPGVEMTGSASPADLIITGRCEIEQDQLTITAEMIDARHSLGAAKAHGSTRDLFLIEKSAAQQLAAILSPPRSAATMPAGYAAGSRFAASDLARSLDSPESYLEYAQQTTYERPYTPPDLYPTYGTTYPSYYPNSYVGYPFSYGPTVVVINQKNIIAPQPVPAGHVATSTPPRPGHEPQPPPAAVVRQSLIANQPSMIAQPSGR
jgi:TolB-like protein